MSEYYFFERKRIYLFIFLCKYVYISEINFYKLYILGIDSNEIFNFGIYHEWNTTTSYQKQLVIKKIYHYF